MSDDLDLGDLTGGGLALDFDGDGVVDFSFGGEPTAAPELAPVDLHGDPAEDADVWFEQSADGLCVPASIAMILAEFRGVPNGSALVDSTTAEAEQLGFLTETQDGFSGMYPEQAATLLTDMGVPAHVEYDGTVDDLRDYLSDGREIILSVDSHELPAWDEADVSENADHAVVITGIDDRTGLVYLNDPGHPDGRAEVLTIAELQQAWDDSGNTMVVTDESTDVPTVTEPTLQLPVDISELTQPDVHQAFVLLPIVVSRLLPL